MAIYAGADLFLMPSKSEPCGLSQMIAMRYGTVPIVRETGGLKDTVSPYESWRDAGNGFTFANYAGSDMLYVIREAVYLYKDYPDAFARLRARAMACDFSWARSAGSTCTFTAPSPASLGPCGGARPDRRVRPGGGIRPAEETAPAEAAEPASDEPAPQPTAEAAQSSAEPAAEEAAPAAPEKKPAARKRTAAKKPAAKKTAAKSGRRTPAKKETKPKKGTAGKQEPAE